MFKEITNNVHNALFVVTDEEGRRYAAFENDWNGEYWEATACTESGELLTGESTKLYPVVVYHAEFDLFKEIGYSEERSTISPIAYTCESDRVLFVLPEGAGVYANSLDLPVIDFDGFTQDDVLNQYDGQGCRPYIINGNNRRAYLEVLEG